jgi:hypothetical protein
MDQHESTMRTSPSTGSGLRRSVGIGVLATVTMDCAFVLAARLRPGVFDPEEAGPDLVGRWAGGVLRGRVRHKDIAREPEMRGETAIGLATHYVTGVGLTLIYHAASGKAAPRHGMARAIGWGVATGALPCLILYPSYGYGCCARRTGRSTRIVGVMLMGHTVFGAGIGFWSKMLHRDR